MARTSLPLSQPRFKPEALSLELALEIDLQERLARRHALPQEIESVFDEMARQEREAARYAELQHEAQERLRRKFCPCRKWLDKRNWWRCDRCRSAVNEIKRYTRRMVKARHALAQNRLLFDDLMAEADQLKVRL